MNAQPSPVLEFPEITGRSEEQAVFNDAEEFICVGGKQYGLRKLTIGQARAWRKKFSGLLAMQEKAAAGGGPELQLQLTDDLLVQLTEIVAQYCQPAGLSREIIEAEGTEDELMEAFQSVVRHSRVPFEKLGKI